MKPLLKATFVLAILFIAGAVIYWMPFTTTPKSFNEDQFRNLPLGLTVEEALKHLGSPYYAWESDFLDGKIGQGRAILPSRGEMLSWDEISNRSVSGKRLSLFYSKQSLGGLQFVKFVLHFDSGRLVDKTEALED